MVISQLFYHLLVCAMQTQLKFFKKKKNRSRRESHTHTHELKKQLNLSNYNKGKCEFHQKGIQYICLVCKCICVRVYVYDIRMYLTNNTYTRYNIQCSRMPLSTESFGECNCNLVDFMLLTSK